MLEEEFKRMDDEEDDAVLAGVEGKVIGMDHLFEDEE